METESRLVRLCIEAACQSRESIERWRRQRRTLERMPSVLADALLHRLLQRRLLFPSLLEVFKNSVEDVDLRGENTVDAEWMAYIGAFRYLHSLNLADCHRLNSSALWPLIGMTRLKEVDVSRCVKVTDAGIRHLVSISTLEVLRLSGTSLTEQGIMLLSTLGELLVLDLGDLPVTDRALASLQALAKLEYLDLWGSNITDKGVPILNNFPKLSYLSLAWTGVTSFPNMPSIGCLNLSNCTIDSALENDGKQTPLTKLILAGATINPNTNTLLLKTMSDTIDQMTSEQHQFTLPGFRFHPTEEELIDFYLNNMVFGKKLSLDVIGYLNIYRYDPRDLPKLAKINGEREWYFIVPRDRKHGGNGRPNRTTEKGFWKATGSDRKIWRLSEPKRQIGLRKTLVFYQGRAPKGIKTDWVMNEYRLPDSSSPLPKEVVLCKIYRKATSLRVLEQRAEMEGQHQQQHSQFSSPLDTSSPPLSMSSSFCGSSTTGPRQHQQEEEDGPPHQMLLGPMEDRHVASFVKREEADDDHHPSYDAKGIINHCNLLELQVPKISMDWNQDQFWLASPWLHQNLTPLANLLNL